MGILDEIPPERQSQDALHIRTAQSTTIVRGQPSHRQLGQIERAPPRFEAKHNDIRRQLRPTVGLRGR